MREVSREDRENPRIMACGVVVQEAGSVRRLSIAGLLLAPRRADHVMQRCLALASPLHAFSLGSQTHVACVIIVIAPSGNPADE